MAASQKQYPKDAIVIMSMMKELGITDFEPRVVNQLLEFATRYVTCCLDDARAFANHSKKKAIDGEDIKLAVMMQMDKVFSSPPPRDLLLEVARTKNNVALPQVKPHCGIRLPPDRYCFSSCNYKLKTNASKKGGAVGNKNFSFTSGNKKITTGQMGVKRPTGLTFTPGSSSEGASLSIGNLGSASKVSAKPKVVIATPTSSSGSSLETITLKTEPDEGISAKRKRDDDDMEVVR